jgi:hypothetical protein
LIERSKEMSGESLRAMIVRAFSNVTSVASGGGSSRVPQPSSQGARCVGS